MPPSADFQDFLNHLTENALASLKHADGVARSSGSPYVGTEHLLPLKCWTMPELHWVKPV
jgi:hypothetical protein